MANSLYKGTIFPPPHKSTWKVLQPFESRVAYTGYSGSNISDVLIASGLLLRKTNPNIFIIPPESRFKVVYRKVYGGSIEIRLEFTQALNKGGPVLGAFAIIDPEISIEAEQLS